MSVRYAEAADNDLAEIAAWIARDSVSAAITMTDRLMDACEALAENPRRFALIGHGELRKRACGDYVVVYRVEDQVQILRILHAARDWTRFADELDDT